jgi:Leucine-rich repeat (LRR) protein
MKPFLPVLILLVFPVCCTVSDRAGAGASNKTAEAVPPPAQRPNASGDVVIGRYNYSEDGPTILDGGLSIRVDPRNPRFSVSLAGVEQWQEITWLTIYGNNFDEVDFSPLTKLGNLRRLEIAAPDEGEAREGFTRIPDLNGLDMLNRFDLANANIMSLDGIEKMPRLRHFYMSDVYSVNMAAIDMRALGQLEELTQCDIVGGGDIAFTGWTGPANLKRLYISKNYNGTVDCTGIGVLSGLTELDLSDCSAGINFAEAIGDLKNLETLKLNIVDPEQDLGFLGSMTSLRSLVLYADFYPRHISFYDEEKHNYIRIDAAIFAGLNNLYDLTLQGFTIENFHLLDRLSGLEWVNVINSKFLPGTDNTLEDKAVIYEPYGDH